MPETRLASRLAGLTMAIATCAGLVSCGVTKEPDAAPRTTATDQATTAAPTSSAPPTTAAPLDPCQLLPRAEAETVAGTPLQDATAVQETCTYTGPPTGPTAQVEVFIGDGAKKILDVDKDLDHPFETLTGIGEEAYIEENAIFFRKGSVWVSIRLVLLNDPVENKAPLEAAARMVAARV